PRWGHVPFGGSTAAQFGWFGAVVVVVVVVDPPGELDVLGGIVVDAGTPAATSTTTVWMGSVALPRTVAVTCVGDVDLQTRTNDAAPVASVVCEAEPCSSAERGLATVA